MTVGKGEESGDVVYVCVCVRVGGWVGGGGEDGLVVVVMTVERGGEGAEEGPRDGATGMICSNLMIFG